MTAITSPVVLLLQASVPGGTGLEWMTIASFVIPALIILCLVYYGDRFAPS